MKIIKHGKIPEPGSTVRVFSCPYCGCVFETEVGEYTFHVAGIFGEPEIMIFSKCPECSGTAKEIIMRSV